ncbi:mate-domain-containing protein [Aspergillus alliaceus]|uniref:Mate-domain-containing protein n=1 Tax=Petromyces alliaceus TaxID=209559 RepID=A0A5N7BSU5_PETAA|nr:mate-domain-containing protein [Aspergillus alliaceus]
MPRQHPPRHNDLPNAEEEPTEYTSLFPKPTDNDTLKDADTNDGYDSSSEGWHRYLGEFWILLKGSIPVILAYTLQNSLQTVSVLIVGRSSPGDLATSAFSLMFAMITAWMIALGGTTALDTLASSSFTGSSNKHDLGVLLQRGFFVLSLFYTPVAILWACSEPVFLFLGQDHQLSRDSARFLSCLIPGGLGYIYFELIKKYLQAQGIMRPGTYVLMITSPFNALLNYLCCYAFDMGLLGAPFALGISYWLSFILLALYARFVAGSECWGGWSREAFQNLGTFARLAFLGIIHVGTEWWAFEIVALAAGRLGTIALAAQSVIMTADQVLNTIPFGVGVATSARVGNLLGSRNAPGAAKAANTAAWLSIFLGAVVLVVLMGTRHDFAKIFNSDERVVRLTAEVLPYVALFQIADGLNGSCGGSLRGMGRQHVGAMINLVSYYCGALPLGIWLAFHGWGLKGLWMGQCIALYLVGALEWMIVALSNWNKEVDKAFARMDVERLDER